MEVLNTRRIEFILAVACIMALLGVSSVGCAATTGENESSAYILKPEARDELIAFVNESKDFVLAEGKDKALQVFNDPKGKFIRGELYIIAYDFNGTRLANINKKSGTIGENVLNNTDSNDVAIVRNMLNLAKRGGGFTYYVWPNPAHSNAEEFKLTYVLKVDDGFWLASGMYLPGVSPIFSNESRKGLVSFVENAREFALNHTKKEALKAFNDKNGKFVKGNSYIFANDFLGHTLAMPFMAGTVGDNETDFQDLNGVYYMREFSDITKSGHGFAYIVMPDPAQNTTPKLKLEYLTKVNDDWFLGSGIYWPGA